MGSQPERHAEGLERKKKLLYSTTSTFILFNLVLPKLKRLCLHFFEYKEEAHGGARTKNRLEQIMNEGQGTGTG